jgi:Aspartyl protease
VFHDLADGRIVSRADQYSIVDMRNPEIRKYGMKPTVGWVGVLNTNRHLMMQGWLYEQSGLLYYSENLVDFKVNPKGELLMMATAYCGTDPGGDRWRVLTRSANNPSPPPPPQVANLEPPAPAGAPVQLAPSAISTGNSVPILVTANRALVAVTLGDFPLPQTMVIDTGASVMSIPRWLAVELAKRGEATFEGQINLCIADGSCTARDRVFISKVTVGSRVVENVEAGIAPDGADMLLPFSVITHAGRATIDTEKGLLIFG